jgi:hypothetical protein
MKKPPVYNRNTGLSLIQPNDGREFLLEKMRGKLAGASVAHIEAAEKRRVRARKTAMDWTWRIALAVAVVSGNIVYLASRPDAPVKAAEKKAAKLAAPKAVLSLNEQALYWAYALYDFDQLKTRYGVSPYAIVDGGVARARLQELFPKADARTRFVIERMVPKTGRKS